MQIPADINDSVAIKRDDRNESSVVYLSTGTSRAENNRQQVAGHDDWPNIFLARTNPDFGWSK